MLLCRSSVQIRVWRSLVSRLTGGQEAAGSSPVTRTKREEHCQRQLAVLFSFGLCVGLNLRPLALKSAALWPLERPLWGGHTSFIRSWTTIFKGLNKIIYRFLYFLYQHNQKSIL